MCNKCGSNTSQHRVCNVTWTNIRKQHKPQLTLHTINTNNVQRVISALKNTNITLNTTGFESQ